MALMRILSCLGAIPLLAACSLLPTVARPEPQLTVVSLSTATTPPTPFPSSPETSAQRFLPLLLTLDDFPEGIGFSAPELVSNIGRVISVHTAFSASIAYGFDRSGSDFLGGVTGFLETEALVAQFDEGAPQNIRDLASNFLQEIAGQESPPLTAEDTAYLDEIPADQMPPKTYWVSEFARVNDRLVRLDVVTFRRENVGVYFIYVSAPARQPLLNITEITALLDQRIQTSLQEE